MSSSAKSRGQSTLVPAGAIPKSVNFLLGGTAGSVMLYINFLFVFVLTVIAMNDFSKRRFYQCRGCVLHPASGLGEKPYADER